MKSFGAVVLIIYITAFRANGANILYIAGVASKSHFIWNRPLIYGLAAKGHNVTALSLHVEEYAPENVHFIHIEGVYDSILNDSSSAQSDFFGMGKMSPLGMLFQLDEFGISCCRYGLESKGFKTLMNYPSDFKFDLIINDYLVGPCLSAAALHKFNRPPLVAVTAYNGMTTTTPLAGSFAYSGIIPNHDFDANEDMCFIDRVKNFFYDYYEHLLKEHYTYPTMDKLVRTVIPDIDYVSEFNKLTRIVLLNANAAIQFSEPSMPNVIGVGGLQIHEPKPLAKELQTVMDNAKKGAVLFSLGSNVRSDTLGKERILAILEAMRAFSDIQFLWKFESNTFPMEVPKNVLIKPWMPQNDLLAHPNMKLFITHSGLLSTQEAIWFGVPLIGFPVFADQYRNINYCTKVGIAKRLSIDKVNTVELKQAIEDMITDPKYFQNMKQLSKVFRDQPEKPLERAVWWVEWVLRNPDANHLQSSAIGTSWARKYAYDVLLAIFMTVAILIHIIVFSIYHFVLKKRPTLEKRKSKGE